MLILKEYFEDLFKIRGEDEHKDRHGNQDTDLVVSKVQKLSNEL